MPETGSSRATAENDDWYRISDPVMRKRTQNRLAQRKHRRVIGTKLKLLEQMVGQPEDSSLATLQPSLAAGFPRNASIPATGLLADQRPDMFYLGSLNGSGLEDAAAAATSPVGYAPTYMSRHHCTSDVAASAGMTMDSGRTIPQTSTLADGALHQEGLGHRPLAPDTTNFAGPSYFQAPGMANDIQHSDYHGLPKDVARLRRYSDLQNHTIDCHDSSSLTFSDFRLNQDSASQFSALHSSSSSRSSIEQMHRCPSSTTPSSHDDLRHRRDSSVDASATLGSRIESALKAIRPLGFDSIDELAAQYYAADLQDRPILAHTQRLSRRRGLTRVLTSIREDARDNWTDWEAQGYREEIVRAAEEVLDDEFSQFSKAYASSHRPGGTTAELNRLFQDELPNLYSLLGVLGLSVQQQGNEDRTAATVHAISMLLHDSSKRPGCI